MTRGRARGARVVAVYTREVAENKATEATEATDAGRNEGYRLLFTTEPEEQTPIGS
jgi:ATP-dependent Clp protease adaptor protein ClpS